MYGVIRGPREGWLFLLLLLAVVLSPALSLAGAAWVEDLWAVPWLAFSAVLLGFVLAKLPVRSPVAHLFALETGVAVIGTLFANLSDKEPWNEKFYWLWERIWAWIQVVFGGGMSNDTMIFALIMALTAWLLGYLAAWLAFRHHSVWLSLLACGTGLLVNLSYGGPNQFAYFLLFLLAAMLLLSRLTLFQRQRDWETADAEHPSRVTFGFLARSGLVSAVIVILAWMMPTGAVDASVAEGWYQITGPWQGLQVEFDRVFASVGSSTKQAEGNRFTNTLALKGAIELGQEPVMLVSSPVPEYWGARTYDRYTNQGWLSSASESTRLDSNDPRLAGASAYQARIDVEQRFKLLAGGMSSIFAAGIPVSIDVPTYADHFDTLDLVSALRPTVPLRRGQQYSVVSSVSVAGVSDLRKAGTDYPAWTDRYLELPRSSLGRVRSLARRLAQDTNDPYDAAVAIEQYLRDLKYEIDVTPPPPNRDAVDWFLFVSREGYCDYFASAMAVMARTLGIPSRVVSGYNTGTVDPETGLYVVRQENAHSWPELFFPQYGWVRFEPTPSQPVPIRPEESPVQQDNPVDALSQEELDALGPDLGGPGQILLDDGWDTSAAGGSSTGGIAAIGWPLLLLPISLITCMLLLWLVWRHIASPLTASVRAYLQMYLIAGLLGWRLRPSDTPGEYSRILGSASPELRPHVETVVRSYVEEVYGGRRAADGEAVGQSWRNIRFRLPLNLLRRKLFRH